MALLSHGPSGHPVEWIDLSYHRNPVAPKAKEGVEMPNIIDDTPADRDSNAPVTSEQLARQQAIKQIERRRRFRISAAVSAVGMILLVIIWATSEYHNAGGWPANGFSQSSGIHDVWNFWIIYPLVAWALLLAADGWFVYGHKPISESEIKREVERQAGPPR